MANNNIESKAKKRRAQHGSLIAENAVVLYVLFFFLFFPLVDLGAMGLRTFFLWYTCNQSAMAGSKGTQWSPGNNTTNTNYETSIQTQATTTATSVSHMFSGISINSGYPTCTVILSPINHTDTEANQASAPPITYTNGSGLPLATPMDVSQYIPILRVQINGTVQPFIQVPFPIAIPGLTTAFQVSIVSDQQIENAYALST